MVKASWSLFQHHGAAAFELSERSPLPPALCAKDLPGGRTHRLDVCWIRRINRLPVKRDEDSATDSILDTEYCLHWDGDLDNSNDSEDDCGADVESDIEQDNAIEDPECPEQRDGRATPNVPGLSRPLRKWKWQAEEVLVTVSAIETRRNKGVKKT